MNNDLRMSRTDDAIATTWAIAAARAPAIAWRRSIARAFLALLTIPGTLELSNLVLWSLRSGQPALIALIGLHALALGLAVGVPAFRADPATDPAIFRASLARRVGDRTDRLRALRRAVLGETVLLFTWAPLFSLATGARLQWGVPFVIAFFATSIIWPFERMALAQRDEVHRLIAEDR